MRSLILVLSIIIWGIDGASSNKVPLLNALVTHHSPLLAFSEMVLAIFPASRVSSVVLFGCLMASVSGYLTIPLSLITILILPL